MYMRFPAFSTANLGRCSGCMRKAFRLALGGWALYVSADFGGPQLKTLMAVLASGLSALWIAHLAAFASRHVVSQNRDVTPSVPARRDAIVAFSQALALVAFATALPTRGRAQSVCGCRVGDVCCKTETQVTWVCTDVQGCTQWILQGNPCQGQGAC